MEAEERPKFRDIRRYFCEFCGICRSKKTLITSHMNSHHKVVSLFPYFTFGIAKSNLLQETSFKFQLGECVSLIIHGFDFTFDMS